MIKGYLYHVLYFQDSGKISIQYKKFEELTEFAIVMNEK